MLSINCYLFDCPIYQKQRKRFVVMATAKKIKTTLKIQYTDCINMQLDYFQNKMQVRSKFTNFN